MTLVKRLESAGKRLGATLLALALWRPGRRERPLGRPRRVLLVRTDNRVGEALLTTPLLNALATLESRPEVDILVHPRALRVLAEHPRARRVLALGSNTTLRALRRERYDVVVDCGNWTEPSVRNAIIARLCGPRAAVLGPGVRPVRWLHTHPVSAREDTRSETAQRMHLLAPLGLEAPAPLSFRTPHPAPRLEPLLARMRTGRWAVVNPGGRLGWRRIPPDAFAAGARALIAVGVTPLVTWGPGEEPLAREVVAAAPGAELAPDTDLDGLAALMRASVLTLCNNTGPMHLSVALGAPTLALFLRMDVERWGHLAPPHRMVDLTAAAERGEPLGPHVGAEVRAFLRAGE
ncbi:MAG: heptosyltransferase [Myxococcaceae bacterium]|nr:heptosyltransferase [Myxococcaceae bacterium]MCI0671821.1 heptosyltransferase [Myxococcaceae bacterium]